MISHMWHKSSYSNQAGVTVSRCEPAWAWQRWMYGTLSHRNGATSVFR